METITGINTVSRRRFLKTTAGGVTALGLAAWWRSPAYPAEEVRFGALCELSGPGSTIGSQQAQGLQLAINEINRTGGILGGRPGIDGRPIKLTIEDTETKAATGLAKAKKLVERDKVHVLTGLIFAPISLAVQEYINKEAKIPFINAGSSNPAISAPPACGKYTFQGMTNTKQLAIAAGNAAKRFGRRWFFIADDYSWGRLSVQDLKDAVKLGSPLDVAGEEYPTFGTTNYAPYITKALAAKPDVIGLVVWGAGYARILSQLHQMGNKAHVHHIFWSQIDTAAAGQASIGMTAADAFVFDHPRVPRAAKFARDYRSAYAMSPDLVASRAYEIAEALAIAVRKADGTNPDGVVRALETTVFNQTLSGELRFRDCDHAAVTPVLVVEGKHNDEYKYYGAYVEQVANAQALMPPCGRTGCEAPGQKS